LAFLLYQKVVKFFGNDLETRVQLHMKVFAFNSHKSNFQD